MKVTERAVQVALHSWLHWDLKRIRITPNFSISHYEADLIAQFAKSRRLQEFEIKVSESDLRREFNGKPGTKTRKHESMKRGEGPISQFFIVTTFEPRIEVPDYCGVIRMRIEEPSGRVFFHGVDRPAPKLHDRPAPQATESRLDAAMYWRAWTYSQRVVDMERENSRLLDENSRLLNGDIPGIA